MSETNPSVSSNERFIAACNAAAIATEIYRRNPTPANQDAMEAANKALAAARRDIR